MSNRREDDRDAESRRILERVARETDPAGASFVGRAMKGVRDHVSAADADAADPIEVWGSRIGRALGIAITVGLLIWLALFIGKGV